MGSNGPPVDDPSDDFASTYRAMIVLPAVW